MKVTQQDLQKAQYTIAEYQRAVQSGDVYGCAAALGTLLEAEETDLITRQWRSYIDVSEITIFMQSHTEVLTTQWQAHYL